MNIEKLMKSMPKMGGLDE